MFWGRFYPNRMRITWVSLRAYLIKIAVFPDIMTPYPHPRGVHLWSHGFSHSRKSVHRTHFTPVCVLVPPFRIPIQRKIRQPHLWSPDFGRSIGIRTRGLLDPKSLRGKNPIQYSPYRAIVSIIRCFPNHPVQLVHRVLNRSGSRFGSDEIAAPLKSEFS